MPEHKKKYVSMKFEKNEIYRTPWNQLSDDEKKEIMERAQKRKEEAQRKRNLLAADVMMGKQRVIDTAWE